MLVDNRIVNKIEGMIMKKLLSTLMCALTFLALLCSLAVPALAIDPAEAPEWEEGDKWAYGTESDMGEEVADQLEDLADVLEGMTDGTVNELSLDGEVGFWMLFEITEATDDVYVLSMDMAAKMSLDVAVSVTAEMQEPGTYDWTDDIPTDEMTVSVDASVDVAVVVNVDITFDRDTMAVESMVMSVKVSAAVDFAAENIPMSEFDWEDMTDTIWYEDYDVSGELELNLELELTIVPGLNLWDFPLAVGDEWSVDSDATLSGSLSGSLDVNGLPEDLKEEIFSEEFIDETGFSDFPIIFEEIDAEPFNNGVLEEISENIEFDLMCTDALEINDPYWGDITVYKIAVADSPLVFYYSPEVGFLSYFSMDSEELMDALGLPTFSQDMTMEAVNPEVAEEGINEISDYQGGIDEGDGGIAGFFMDPPYLGLILVGVIVVVVVAAVLLIRKK
jgi:hypothetical protein